MALSTPDFPAAGDALHVDSSMLTTGHAGTLE
jgi:hypothetical protein